MALPHKTITRITRTLQEVEGQKTKLVCYHLNISMRKSSIWSSKNDWSDPSETAKDIWEAAQQTAQSLGGPQRFQLSIFDLDDVGSEEALRTCPFVVDSGLAQPGDSEVSEPPNNDGLMAQLMRFNNEMFRQHNAAIGALSHHLARTCENQAEQIERLMRDRMQSLVSIEELLSNKHARDLAARENEAAIERKKELFEKVMSLAPIVVNKITGKEMVRQVASPLEATVTAFMETIKPNQLDAIASSGIFNQQQQLLFATLLEQMTKHMISIEEKKQQQEAAAKAVSNGYGT